MLATYHTKGELEVGCDEAGRGCLAGPVFAGAVIFSAGFSIPELNDSKKLSEKKRDALKSKIENTVLAWGVGVVSAQEIDEINILNASFLAMHRALDKLNADFTHILVDGHRFNTYKNIKHSCIIKGDGKIQQIAAASILAKTHRDEYMKNMAQKIPHYDWQQNKGYPTKKHIRAIDQHGYSAQHRKSFKLKRQLELNLTTTD